MKYIFLLLIGVCVMISDTTLAKPEQVLPETTTQKQSPNKSSITVANLLGLPGKSGEISNAIPELEKFLKSAATDSYSFFKKILVTKH